MFSNTIIRCLSTNINKNATVPILSFLNNVVADNIKLPNFLKFGGPTGDEVLKDVDLTGKTCLITGGTSGIGLEMIRCLLKKNCNILMACRNTYAANVAGKKYCQDNSLKSYEANLASLSSVKKCSEKLLKEQSKIDIVILNAAVFGIPWTLTEDSLETIYQVNFLSQFYLLLSIEKILAPDARVVLMSSESHRNVKWTFQQALTLSEDMVSIPYEQYTSIKAYNMSKLCGLLAMQYLGYKWLKTEKAVFCAHPGSIVKTNQCSNWIVYEALYSVMQPFTKNISQAAATPLYCATSPELTGLTCQYYKDCKETQTSDLAQDTYLAHRMFELSQNILSERSYFITTEIIETDTRGDTLTQETVHSQRELRLQDVYTQEKSKQDVDEQDLNDQDNNKSMVERLVSTG